MAKLAQTILESMQDADESEDKLNEETNSLQKEASKKKEELRNKINAKR